MSGLAVVTGGTRGIGKAIATELQENGYDVVVTFRADEEAASRFCQETGIKTFKVDVSDFAQVQAFSERILNDYGQIHVLVNNAGVTDDKMLHKMSESQFDRVISNNLKSCFNASRAFIPSMREHRFGRIINISSVNALAGQFGQTNYCASKSGIIGFTKALALENASHGVTANVIAPGYTETDMVSAINDKVLTQIVASVPMGRLAQPEEIAHAVMFLCSPRAGYITGTTISINGGQYLA